MLTRPLTHVLSPGNMLIPIIRDIVAGMIYLHLASPPVLHNDLKAANILVDNGFRAKVRPPPRHSMSIASRP